MNDEEKELRYEDIDWGKTTLQPDVTYIPELRPEDIDLTKVPYETLASIELPPQPKKRAVRPKPARRKVAPLKPDQMQTFIRPFSLPPDIGEVAAKNLAMSRFHFDTRPYKAFEAMTPKEKLALHAEREQREGRVLPSMRASTPAEIEQVRELERRERKIKTRLEGKSIFGIELPVPETGIESIDNIRRSIGHAHDVLGYQIPNVFLKGVASIPEGVSELSRYVAMFQGVALSENPSSPMMRRFTTQAQEKVEEAFPTREKKHPLAQIAGSAAQFILPGGLLSKAGAPAMFTSGFLGAAMNAQQMAEEMDRAGVDPSKRDVAIGFAIFAGMTEMAGLGALIDKFGLRQTFIKQLLHIAEEGGQELVQQWLNNLNAKLVGGWDPKRPLTKNLVESTILGLGGGALFAGINRAVIRDREKALLRSMGLPAAQTAPIPEQMELKFEDIATPEVAQAPTKVTPKVPKVTPEVTRKVIDVTPEDIGAPEITEEVVRPKDITSFEVRAAKPRKPRERGTTKVGPRVPIDVVPVDDLFGKTDLTPEEVEKAESNAIEAVETSLKAVDPDTGMPFPIPVPAPPLAAIIGPPKARGVGQPDLNLVKERLFVLNGEMRNLEVLMQQAVAADDRGLTNAIITRGMEILSNITEHINFIEENGQDGETFEILPPDTPGQAAVMTVPGWLISAIAGGEDHMMLGGINMRFDDLNNEMGNLSRFAPSPNAARKAERAISDLIDQSEAEGLKSVSLIHQWLSDRKRVITIPHETFHAAQDKLAEVVGALNRYLDVLKQRGLIPTETVMAPEGGWHLHSPEWARTHPVIQRVVSDPFWGQALKIGTIDIYDSVAIELPAYVMGGDAHRLGLSEDEQVEFILDYVEHLLDNYGTVVLDTFEKVARLRPEMAEMLRQSRNKYELWKQSQIEDWYAAIKSFTRPITEEFTGFTQERLESSDPLEGILGPRKAGTRPPTDKTAARLSGKGFDKEAQRIKEALFEERSGWVNDETWKDYWSLSEPGAFAGIWRNVGDTYSATINSDSIGEDFPNLQEAQDAAQKAMDRLVPSRGSLIRRGLQELTKAIEKRLIEINNDNPYSVNVPVGPDDWRTTLNDAIWGTDAWVSDPVLSELREYVKEAYPKKAQENEEARRKYKEDVNQKGWEGKSHWDIEYEEKAAMEAISGPAERFTDVEFTAEDEKQLRALDKHLTKAIQEHGYATGKEGYPTLEQWLDEKLYPITYSEIEREHGEELKAWQQLKNKEYQSKGGKRGFERAEQEKRIEENRRRFRSSLAEGDMPLDPRSGRGPRSENWIGGIGEYEGRELDPEGFELRTGGIGNMHIAEVYPVAPENVVDEGRWIAKVDNRFVGYYPDHVWAQAAAERELDNVDVSWQSVQRRNPEFADLIKIALINKDPQIMFGPRALVFDRIDAQIRKMVYNQVDWSDDPLLGEYQEYLQEMFPRAPRYQRKAPVPPPTFELTEADYAEREREAIAAILDPKADMMAKIREEIAEEKKRESSLRVMKALVDPATAKPGDRIISKTLRKAGEITNLRTDEEGMWAEITFDDGETTEQHVAELKVEPPEVRPRETNKTVPRTEAQQAVAESPVITSAQENIEQLILPGMEQVINMIRQNRPADMVEFDRILNKLLTSKGIKPKGTDRPFFQVLEGLITGKIKADEVNKVLEDNNLTMEQFMNEFKATALESENSSKQLMRTKMRWLKAMKANPDLANAMVFTPSELFKSVMEDINNTRLGLSAWQRASNFIRMLMLSDINTAAVNALMTAGRIPLAAGVHGYGAWMKTMADGKAKGMSLGQRIQESNQQALDAMRVAGNVLLVLNPADMIRNLRKTGTSHAERHTHIYNELVKVFPDLEMKVKAPGIGLEAQATLTDQIDVAKKLIENMRTRGARESSLTDLKVAETRFNNSLKTMGQVARGFEVALEIVLTPMRWQEWFFRKPMFVSYLDLALRRRNMDLADLIRTRELATIPEEALTEAIDEALDFTYAYMPKADGPGFEKSAHHLIKGINELKGVASLVGTMFPRAVYNGMKFTYEYSPFGAYPYWKKKLQPEYVTDPVTNEVTHTNPLTQKDYDRFAKAQLGTIMFVTAMGLLRYGLIGDEWWQVRTWQKDENGKPIYMDIRRYQPFATFFRLADLTTRMLSDAGVMEGKKSMGDLQFGKELKETLTGLRGFPGAEEYLSATVEMWNDQQDVSNVYQKAATSMGVSMSFITRPFVNLRRAVSMFDEDEQKRRDVKGTGFLGPLIDNVPWLRQKMLPEYVSMTEKPPIHIETYPGLAFAGIRLIPAEGFAGREWRRLGFLNRRFLAPDPNPAINRRQNEVFQNIISSAGNFAENNPAYLNLDDKGKAAYWERLVDVLAPIAREIGKTADPKEAMKRDFEQGLEMGPLQRKSMGLNNIFDRKPAPARVLTPEEQLERRKEIERLSRQAVQ